MWRFHSPKISVVQFHGRSLILDLDTVLVEGFILMVCERDFRPLKTALVLGNWCSTLL